MKHLIKYIALICTMCLVLGTLSGCGSEVVKPEFELPAEDAKLADGIVAENQYFTVGWNSQNAGVTFTSKKDGSVWSTIPKDTGNVALQDESGEEKVKSQLSFYYMNEEGYWPTEAFYQVESSCIPNGTFTSEKIENGLSITYYMEDISCIITVDYYLEDDGFKLRIDPAKVKNCGDNYVSKILVAPYLCSTTVAETGNKDSYIAIPSGSGALMYCDVRGNDTTNIRSFEGDVYGEDPAIEQYQLDANITPITMPFYGIKTKESTVCAIIEQGAESSCIYADIQNTLGDIANVATGYNLLSYSNLFGTGAVRKQYKENSESTISPLVVGYYQLTGDDANYTGMAKRYKKHLTEKEGMQKSQDNSLLTVKIIGQYLEDDLFLGIPTKKEVSLTSYAEAEEILNELNSITGGSLIAEMYAYGKGGINAREIAGNYQLTGAVGNKKALKNFVSFTADTGIKTFFNFDPIIFYKSGAGVSVNKDSAKNSIGITIANWQHWYSTRTRYKKNNGGVISALISRKKLAETTAKTVKLADKYGITGLCYDTLGSIAYSDYDEDKNDIPANPLKDKMGSDVANIIKSTKESSKTVMLDGAFSYAAAAADIITNCPTASNQNNCFDADIPLYQIVFQGTKANSCYSINYASNQREQFLKAMETGSGLTFTVMANYNNELRKQHMRGLNASVYADNKERIESFVAESKTYLSSVAGSSIVSHQQITVDVVKTVFDNGVTTIVNYGNKDYQSELGLVKANGFIYK